MQGHRGQCDTGDQGGLKYKMTHGNKDNFCCSLIFTTRCRMILSLKSHPRRKAVHFWKHLDIKRHYRIEMFIRHSDLSWEYHFALPEDA